MKTHRWDDADGTAIPPEVEIAIVPGSVGALPGDCWDNNQHNDDNTCYDGDGSGTFDTNIITSYFPSGQFNSLGYGSLGYWNNNFHPMGSSGRFSNNSIGVWEKKEYTFNLSDRVIRTWESAVNKGAVGSLYLIVQYGNDKKGTMYLDDFEVIESYDFMSDVDVRKKKGPNNYGLGSLTEYYDPEIDFEKYQDTTAPLEAQFYFYARYPFNEVFTDVEKPIIHNDFANGLFFLYDIDWGDGSPNEFTSEPEPLGNKKMVYHTYENSGIYEVTGYMLRAKPDDDYNPLGIIHNKRFTLRINVNKGLDEDFRYFGTDGFSFVPYSETLPIIGGISQESSYYKTIKRQLGYISDDIKIPTNFKKESDKLKSEIALLIMDENIKDNLELLPEFEIPRNSQSDGSGDLIWTGNLYSNHIQELGKSIGDTDITNVRYFNKPKQMWEMLGFTTTQTKIPNSPSYWKNIIPKTTLLTDREGIDLEAVPPIPIIDTSSEQEWIGTNEYGHKYYYPVLPKYSKTGTMSFNPITEDYDYPNNNIPFPSNGAVTNLEYSDEYLKIDINSNQVELNVFDDSSGNNNYGFSFSDYKPKFDNKTLEIKKTKNTTRLKKSKAKRAF
jgi:hypothetical protein